MIAAVPGPRTLVMINAGNYNKADLGGVPWRILLEQILPAVVDGWDGGAG
jgi:hypothetical protein